MNKVVLLGTLVRDVELRFTKNDMAVANFTIAVRREVKNKDGNYDSDFVSCVAYGKLGEIINSHFKKGSRILLDGKIQTGSYDGQDGKKVYTTDIVVNQINFIDKVEKEVVEKSNSEIIRDVATGNYQLPF